MVIANVTYTKKDKPEKVCKDQFSANTWANLCSKVAALNWKTEVKDILEVHMQKG